MNAVATPPATLDDLMRTEGRAELIGGRIVHLVASDRRSTDIAYEIASDLRRYVRQHRLGYVYADGVGYAIRPALRNGRQSFQPDASYYAYDPDPHGRSFVEGPPLFAVEVRSEHDYGRTAEREIAEKRADYFEAGTLLVWDIDPDIETIMAYHADGSPPTTFRRGDEADAEPVIPGWRMAVDEIFTRFLDLP